MANKLLIRLSGKMKFIAVCQCFPDGFITSGDSFCALILEVGYNLMEMSLKLLRRWCFKILGGFVIFSVLLSINKR